MTPFQRSYPRHLDCWSALMISELVRQGVRHCCVAPGSRSTPLLLAALAEPSLVCHHHFDERGLGFFALGLAKSTRAPVAVITTSGTAVANLYSAVIEAAQTEVPLIVLAADRPPELIGCRANQAIDQAQIFAQYPVWQRAFPVPSEDVPPQALLGWIGEAVNASQRGPVLLNCPFREPFYPTAEQQDFSTWLAPVASWLASDQPWSRRIAPAQVVPLDPADFFQAPGLIVAGALTTEADAMAVRDLARRTGWPLLADPQSGLAGDGVITGLDLLLQQPDFVASLGQAKRLLQVGTGLISKRLGQWLAQQSWELRATLSPEFGAVNPDYPAQIRWQGAVAATLQSWQSGPCCPGPDLSHWTAWKNQHCDGFVPMQALNELSAVRWLSAQASGALFLGNSLSVRLFEQLSAQAQSWRPIFCNRGASGIDGLLASSAGVAMGLRQPLTLILGDLSLLHDLNSLALCADSSVPLVIVLLNNDGGAIFNLLPVPDQPEVNDYYRCSHGLKAEGAAAMFGLEYRRPTSLAELARSYNEAIAVQGATLIELCTPPEEATDLLRLLGGEIANARPPSGVSDVG